MKEQPTEAFVPTVAAYLSNCASDLMEECRKVLTPRMPETAYARAVVVVHTGGGRRHPAAVGVKSRHWPVRCGGYKIDHEVL